MEYLVNGSTNVGNTRKNNQDSVLIQLAKQDDQSFLLAAVCDGMGGLTSGEVASTTVVCGLKKWFETECRRIRPSTTIQQIAEDCAAMMEQLNQRLKEYEMKTHQVMGTTASCLMILNDAYAIFHIGDSRVYKISEQVTQMTTDHTVVAREVREGRMTEKEAAVSKDRNKLTQCMGASKSYDPEILSGYVQDSDVFLICSDGFRHHLKNEELHQQFSAQELPDEDTIHAKCEAAIRCVMGRGERDNISVAVVKAKRGGGCA